MVVSASMRMLQQWQLLIRSLQHLFVDLARFSLRVYSNKIQCIGAKEYTVNKFATYAYRLAACHVDLRSTFRSTSLYCYQLPLTGAFALYTESSARTHIKHKYARSQSISARQAPKVGFIVASPVCGRGATVGEASKNQSSP
jgi:hypothetical protein